MPMWVIWGALAGGVALNLWYAIAWMALPHHHGDFESLGKTPPLEGALQGVAPGLYIHPHYKDYAGAFKDPAFLEKTKSSPRAWMVVMGGDCASMGPKVFLTSLLANVIEALGLAILLYLASGHTQGLARAVAFGAGVGGLARFGAYGGLSIWMQLPRRYAATSLFDGVVGFAIAGLVIHFLR